MKFVPLYLLHKWCDYCTRRTYWWAWNFCIWVKVNIEYAPTCLPIAGKIKTIREGSLSFGLSHSRLDLW